MCGIAVDRGLHIGRGIVTLENELQPGEAVRFGLEQPYCLDDIEIAFLVARAAKACEAQRTIRRGFGDWHLVRDVGYRKHLHRQAGQAADLPRQPPTVRRDADAPPRLRQCLQAAKGTIADPMIVEDRLIAKHEYQGDIRWQSGSLTGKARQVLLRNHVPQHNRPGRQLDPAQRGAEVCTEVAHAKQMIHDSFGNSGEWSGPGVLVPDTPAKRRNECYPGSDVRLRIARAEYESPKSHGLGGPHDRCVVGKVMTDEIAQGRIDDAEDFGRVLRRMGC